MECDFRCIGNAVEPLAQMLNDDNEEIRYYVARVLGRLGDKRAIFTLIKWLQSFRKLREESVMKMIFKRYYEEVIKILEGIEESVEMLQQTSNNVEISPIDKVLILKILKQLE